MYKHTKRFNIRENAVEKKRVEAIKNRKRKGGLLDLFEQHKEHTLNDNGIYGSIAYISTIGEENVGEI